MTRTVPALLVAVLLGGCTTSGSERCDGDSACEAERSCARLDDATVRENAAPDVERVAEQSADLTLVVTNSSRPAERLVVRAGQDLLLDALLPPGSDYCGHNPVFSWSYDLPEQRVTVTVAGAGQEGSAVVDARGPRRWVTVMTQDDFPLYVKATEEAPAFG